MLDDDDGSRLIERLPVGRLRPVAPDRVVQRYELGDEVDCLWRDGYWSGHIIGFDSDINAYCVDFPLTGDTRWESHARLRAHFDWTGERFTCQPKFNYML